MGGPVRHRVMRSSSKAAASLPTKHLVSNSLASSSPTLFHHFLAFELRRPARRPARSSHNTPLERSAIISKPPNLPHALVTPGCSILCCLRLRSCGIGHGPFGFSARSPARSSSSECPCNATTRQGQKTGSLSEAGDKKRNR